MNWFNLGHIIPIITRIMANSSRVFLLFREFHPLLDQKNQQQNSPFPQGLGSSRVGSQRYSQHPQAACEGKASSCEIL